MVVFFRSLVGRNDGLKEFALSQILEGGPMRQHISSSIPRAKGSDGSPSGLLESMGQLQDAHLRKSRPKEL